MKISLITIGFFWSMLSYANPPRYFLVDPQMMSLTRAENKSYFSLLPKDISAPLLAHVKPVTEVSCKNLETQPQSSLGRLLGYFSSYLWSEAIPREVLEQLPELLKKDLQNPENQIIPADMSLWASSGFTFRKDNLTSDGSVLYRNAWNELGIPSQEVDIVCSAKIPESKSNKKIFELFEAHGVNTSSFHAIPLPCSLLTHLKNDDTLLLPVNTKHGHSILALKASPRKESIVYTFQDMLGLIIASERSHNADYKFEKAVFDLGFAEKVGKKIKFNEPYNSMLSLDPTQKTTEWEEFLERYRVEILMTPQNMAKVRAEFALHPELENVAPQSFEYFWFNVQARILLLEILSKHSLSINPYRHQQFYEILGRALKEAQETWSVKNQPSIGQKSPLK